MTARRPKIDDEQRRIRLGVRQLLAPSARTAAGRNTGRNTGRATGKAAGRVAAEAAERTVEAMVAVHATDPSTVFLAVAARLAEPGTAPTEQALYDTDTLVRMHGMRHTLFVVPSELAPVVHASTTLKAAARERSRMLKSFTDAGLDPQWVAEVERDTLAALADGSEATGAALGKLVPGLRTEIAYGVGTSYAATQTVGVRLLRVLGMEGSIVRRRPVGSWTSSQHQWALHPPYPELPVAEAQAGLAARWLASYGPGTADDLKWWTGWGVREVRAALAACRAVEVELDGGAKGFVLPDDVEPVAAPEPWAALLPALDPTPMSRQERDWFLPAEHRAELFDRSGNIGPTVWWNGRVVGGWAQRADGEIVRELFAPLGAEAEAAIDREAATLAAWVGATRVTPRFRTPLERRLTA